MKRKVWRIFLWFTGLGLAAIVAFVAVLFANKDRIINRVMEESARLLEEPVNVSAIDLSVRKFPLASVKLEKVFCKGRDALPGDTLIYAEEVFLEFHLWKLITGNWGIEGISLEQGVLNLRFPAHGQPNYHIWKDRETDATASVFDLKAVHTHHMAFRLDMEKEDLQVAAQIHSAELAGIFLGENYDLTSSAEFALKELLYHQQSYLQPDEILARLDLHGQKDSLHLSDGKLSIAGFEISFNGGYNTELFRLAATGNNFDIKALNDFYVRQNWSETRVAASVSGEADLIFTGKFPLNEEEASYELAFEVDRGILSKELVEVTGLQIAGRYVHQDGQDDLYLNSFSGKGRSGRIKGSLSLADLNSPAVNLKLVSDLDLAEWMLLLPIDTLTRASGRMAVDIELSNHLRSLKQLTAAELKKTRARGSINLKEVGFSFKNSDKTIADLNASLSFGGDHLDIDNFYFRTGQSDVYLTGHFSNVLGYLFFKEEKLKLDTKVKSQELHVEDFLVTGKSSNGEYSIEFARSIEMDLLVDVEQLYFDSFYAEKVKGNLNIRNGLIQGKQLSFDADDGSFKGEFTINMKGSGNYHLMANLEARHTNLHDLFISFGNFGQEELVAENIYGVADMKLRLTSSLTPSLYLPPESVYLSANLNIRDGILKDYQPMMALSDYAAIDELKEVRFSQLSNEITIAESVIYIPEMLIESNVLNLQLNGEHHFDNRIDYSMKLRLADVIFRKRKKDNQFSEFDDHLTEMEKTDDPNIYVKMSGTTSYPIISLDKERMNRSIKDDIKKQGAELKQIFTKKEPDQKKKKSSGIEYTLFEDEDDGKN